MYIVYIMIQLVITSVFVVVCSYMFFSLKAKWDKFWARNSFLSWLTSSSTPPAAPPAAPQSTTPAMPSFYQPASQPAPQTVYQPVYQPAPQTVPQTAPQTVYQPVYQPAPQVQAHDFGKLQQKQTFGCATGPTSLFGKVGAFTSSPIPPPSAPPATSSWTGFMSREITKTGILHRMNSQEFESFKQLLKNPCDIVVGGGTHDSSTQTAVLKLLGEAFLAMKNNDNYNGTELVNSLLVANGDIPKDAFSRIIFGASISANNSSVISMTKSSQAYTDMQRNAAISAVQQCFAVRGRSICDIKQHFHGVGDSIISHWNSRGISKWNFMIAIVDDELTYMETSKGGSSSLEDLCKGGSNKFSKGIASVFMQVAAMRPLSLIN